jgi:hypothetical protein
LPGSADVTLHDLLIAVGPLLPLIGFFWANCPCCTPGCENCPEATDALAVTLAGITDHPSATCGECPEFNGTWIVPYWPESASNTATVCDWKLELPGVGGCPGTVNPAMTARTFASATVPAISAHVGYYNPAFPPTHANNLVNAFGWTESNSTTPAPTQAEVCDTYDLGYDFVVTAAQGACNAGTDAATCHVEGA